MGTWFHVKKGEKTGFSITLHSSAAQELGISYNDKTIWRFGLQKSEVKVILSKQINKNEIVMTEDVINSLMLPLYPTYEVLYDQNEFHIGPIIGIAIGRTLKKLDEKVHKLGRYVRGYQQIGGAIIAFSNEGVDREKKLVIGYLYDPFKKEWVKGIYPYPLSIFKKTSLNRELSRHFESMIGNRIFNSSTFDKWQMYTWFNQASSLKPFLPETKIFQTIQNAEQMIDKFGAAYIKPIKGMQGKKVAKIEKEGDSVVLQYIEGDSKNYYMFNHLDEAKDFLLHHFSRERFILQQPLNLKFNDSIIDFRVIMIKDQTGEWKNFGIMGRNGVKGQIVSNRHRGGKVEQADITLGKMFEDKQKIVEYKQKMEQLALKAAQTIENCGFHFGKLGIDIGIDIDGKVWLIEINHRNPNDFVASFSGDTNLVNQIRLANMLYAKNLAGFK